MKRTRRETLVKTVVAWIVALIWILPLMGVVMTALRPFSEVIDGWWKLEPFNATLSNFSGALNHRTAALYKGMINSLMIAIPATIAPLLLATLAGYGISRYGFPLRKTFILTVVLTLALPQQMIAIPIFRIMSNLGLVDTFFGLILLHTAWGIPWITFFMRNYFKTLPADMEEAARIDGAGDFGIFFRVVLPNAFPASDFFLALILIYSPEKLLATQRIPLMRGVYHVDWGLLSAASLLVMTVPVLIYVLLQRYYVRGMVGWTIK